MKPIQIKKGLSLYTEASSIDVVNALEINPHEGHKGDTHQASQQHGYT
jgi:hypothetical protein